MNTREQGDIGELSAAEWFTWEGGKVAVPLGHSPDWDLLVEFEDRIARVQVKTSTFFRDGRWEVGISTRGGNQSWTGVVKRFSPAQCDYLFVHVGDGRRWCIPADEVGGGTGLLLGGPKYARFEVDPGRPIGQKPGPLCKALESVLAPGGAPELESRGAL